MYPELPESAADLVPLPLCDGPKLEPFDFQGPQKIEFLEDLGEGLHSHVVKVKILEQVYALKIFRFPYHEDWIGPDGYTNPKELEPMSAFYPYSEPFNCECRAFGRLKETGYEELAVDCFGYVLLDDDSECAMKEKFKWVDEDFNGNPMAPGMEDVRGRFRGKGGRLPPIRGIVKAFGPCDEPLRATRARRVLRDAVRLQQLGIINFDVAHRQLIGGKISDFSTAITTPHFVTNPELNPHITPYWISRMEFEAFRYSLVDYLNFEGMVEDWNHENKNPEDQISVHAFPIGHGGRSAKVYNLRSTPDRERVYSLVDPRTYDWKATTAAGAKSNSTGAVTKQRPRPRLSARPPRWYYPCDAKAAEKLRSMMIIPYSICWKAKDGQIFPAEVPSSGPLYRVGDY